MRIYLEVEVRRVQCRRCGKVKQAKFPWLADNPFDTKRFAWYVGRRCWETTGKEVEREFKLDWTTGRPWTRRICGSRSGARGRRVPRPSALTSSPSKRGIQTGSWQCPCEAAAEMVRVRGSLRTEHGYDLAGLAEKKPASITRAVLDMGRAFETSPVKHAPQAAILDDTFHVLRHLGKALDTVRKQEYRRLDETDRSFIKGQKDPRLSRKKNLPLEGGGAQKALQRQ